MSRALAVLRPEPGNAATAARIERRGRHALRLPLFAVHPVAWSPPDPARYDCLLLSSANAVRHAGPSLSRLAGLPVHAVGEATASAARAAGLSVVETGRADVAALRPSGRVLRLVGRDYRRMSGTDDVVVYASERLFPELTPLFGAIALVHSPRAARVLGDSVDRSTIALAAISDAAAEAGGDGWRAVAVAETPTDDALIAAAIGLDD